jgi:hypothetical protein
MIRPLTLLTLCAAAGAGLWLYQVKHAASQLDRELREINRRTEQARERTQVLRAEWALLNEPDRLRQVAQRHLPLEPMAPAQFVRLGDVGARLPAPRHFAGAPSLFAPTEEPGDGRATAIALADATPRGREAPPPAATAARPAAPAPAPEGAPVALADATPVIPATPPAAARTPATTDARPAEAPPAPRAAAPRAAAPRPAPPQPVVQPALHVAPRAPAPPPQTVANTVVRPVVTSSLGGAAMGTLAPPVPIARAAAATIPPGAAR